MNKLLISLELMFLVSPLAAMKREAPEPDKPHNGSAIKVTKKLEYFLKVPLSPKENFDETINLLKLEDIIAANSLMELLEERIKENRDFIIARVPTKHEQKSLKEYYELPNINRYLYDGKIYPTKEQFDAQRAGTLKTPNRAQINGLLDYFIYDKTKDAFIYFANTQDLLIINEKKENILNDNRLNRITKNY